MKHISPAITLLVILFPFVVLGQESQGQAKTWGCPTLNLHCYKKQGNRLVEIPIPDRPSFETQAVGVKPLCETKQNAFDSDTDDSIFAQAAFVCGKNGADFLSIGEKPYASAGEMFPFIKYLPGFSALPVYKVSIKNGKNLPEPGDIVSIYGLLWNYGRGVYRGLFDRKRFERKREDFLSGGDPTCARYELVCSNNPHRPTSEDYYTGISAPGCYRTIFAKVLPEGWLKKCRVCRSLERYGKEFCKTKSLIIYKYSSERFRKFKKPSDPYVHFVRFKKPSYQFAHFVRKEKFREL